MQGQSHGTTDITAVTMRTGVIGGMIGGVAMAMLMMVVTAAKGMGFFKPLYLIAATFHQTWAMQTGFALGPALVGAMLHMMLSIIFGLVFIMMLTMVAPSSAGAPLWAIAGMVWGVIVLVVNQYVVLPVVDPAMSTATSGLLFWWVVAHVMFGLALGIVGASLAPGNNRLGAVIPRSRLLHESR